MAKSNPLDTDVVFRSVNASLPCDVVLALRCTYESIRCAYQLILDADFKDKQQKQYLLTAISWCLEALRCQVMGDEDGRR